MQWCSTTAPAAYRATRHLFDQGYRHIAHFGGPQHLNIYKNRLQGYKDALLEQGVPYKEELVIISDMKIADGTDGMERLLKLPQPPDAIFSASDFTLVGALEVLKAHGVQVPAEVGLAGFSNELFSCLTEPKLTSIDQHCEQMGQLRYALAASAHA